MLQNYILLETHIINFVSLRHHRWRIVLFFEIRDVCNLRSNETMEIVQITITKVS